MEDAREVGVVEVEKVEDKKPEDKGLCFVDAPLLLISYLAPIADEIDMFDGVVSDSGLFVEDRPDKMKVLCRFCHSGRYIKYQRQIREAEPSDDSEGYYRFQLGEVLGGHYQITGFHGQGNCCDMWILFIDIFRCVQQRLEGG